MKYAGIDLHSNNSVVTVTDEEDRVLAENRLPNDLGKIVGLLSQWREELPGILVESTFNWCRLVDGLHAAGFKVHLPNTMAIKKYDGLKHSGDEAEARYLAHVLRLRILPTGTILPPDQRVVRDLARKRMRLVRSRATHVVTVENITARQHGGWIGCRTRNRCRDTLPRMKPSAVLLRAESTCLGASPPSVERRAGERRGRSGTHSS